MKYSNSNSKGQVMLVSILIMGGMMAIAMAVSLLFLQEIRLARQTPESVKAIYAADAGIECGLYQYFVYRINCTIGNPICGSALGDSLSNEATYETNLYCGASTSTVAFGASKGVQRALTAGPLP